MRDAATILGIIHERGKRGLPLEDVYRQLYNPDLYLCAYGRLYANQGALTRGATEETVDGMSREKIMGLIDALRHERYRWTPVRRTYIPKQNGKLRPLGMPTWSDKLLQEVLRLLLEAYYEPQFSTHSHGFRPGRGCHTALRELQHCWTGTKWFIEGDIAACFDRLDHSVMLNILRDRIHDNRFLRLVETMLQAGYLEDWRWHSTLSGTPQGGVVSPILSNIYLDRLDRFVETTLLPQFNRGTTRKLNPAYERLNWTVCRRRKQGRHEEATRLRAQMRQLPSVEPSDPDYRRLRYLRYADDFLLGFTGPKVEAEAIKETLRTFMHDDLKLELSPEKTLITHATTEMARFLGYHVTAQWVNDYLDHTGHRRLTGTIALRVPAEVIDRHCRDYLRAGKPTHRSERIHDSDFSIVAQYQAAYRGLVEYYRMAHNVGWFNRLHWVMHRSLLKTLAAKHTTSIGHILTRYKSTTETEYGPMACLKVVIDRGAEKKPLVAQFGGIPLRRHDTGRLPDRYIPIVNSRNELVKRLLADTCELCGSTEDIQVHHIRRLADLKTKGRAERPAWIAYMASRRRKTLVACRQCHRAIHNGRQDTSLMKRRTGEPGASKDASPVRGGADGKGL